MTALATWEDVQAQWRPLTPAEQGVATKRLDQASAIIRANVPDVDARMADGADYANLVVGTVCDMVIRYMRNPDAKIQEKIDDYSYMKAQTSDDGRMYLLPDELELLLGTPQPDGAFTITPAYTPPTVTVPWA